MKSDWCKKCGAFLIGLMAMHELGVFCPECGQERVAHTLEKDVNTNSALFLNAGGPSSAISASVTGIANY